MAGTKFQNLFARLRSTFVVLSDDIEKRSPFILKKWKLYVKKFQSCLLRKFQKQDSNSLSQDTLYIPEQLNTAQEISISKRLNVENYQYIKSLGKLGKYYQSLYVKNVSSNVFKTFFFLNLDYETEKDIEYIIRNVLFTNYLHHRNILDYEIIYVEGELLWGITDGLISSSLRSFITSYFPNGINELATLLILKSILNGLSYLHKNNIIHMSLTSHNVVVTSDLDIKITGFDQAVDMEEVLNVGKYACKFHASVEFLPYEIVINSERISKATDIYTLGLTASELLLGKPIFHETDVLLIIAHQVFPDELFMKSFSHGSNKISKETIDLVLSCVSKRPDKRPSCDILLTHEIFSKNKMLRNPLKFLL